MTHEDVIKMYKTDKVTEIYQRFHEIEHDIKGTPQYEVASAIGHLAVAGGIAAFALTGGMERLGGLVEKILAEPEPVAEQVEESHIVSPGPGYQVEFSDK